MNYEQIRQTTEHYPVMQGLSYTAFGFGTLLMTIYYKLYTPWNSLTLFDTLIIMGCILFSSYGAMLAEYYYQKKFGKVKNVKSVLHPVFMLFSLFVPVFISLPFQQILNPPFAPALLIFAVGAVLYWYIFWRKLSWHPLVFAVVFLILSFVFPPPLYIPNTPADTPEAKNHMINMFMIASIAAIFYGLIGHSILLWRTQLIPKMEDENESVQGII